MLIAKRPEAIVRQTHIKHVDVMQLLLIREFASLRAYCERFSITETRLQSLWQFP